MAQQFNWEGAGQGAVAGGTAGASTGNPYVAAGAAVAGGLIGGFSGKKKPSSGFDINAVMAQIRAEYAKARAAAIQQINTQAIEGRKNIIQSQANAGVMRSPFAANAFERLEASRIGAIGAAEGQMAASQADKFASLLLGLNQQRLSQDELEARRRAERTGSIVGLGSSLLQAALMSRGGGSGMGAKDASKDVMGGGSYSSGEATV